MIKGRAIISKLSERISIKESVSSSHWDKYHENFRYELNSLRGVQGFGHLNRNYGFISDYIHKFFQKKYRKIVSQNFLFKQIDDSAFKITKTQNRANNLDVLRQSLTLDFLNHKIDFKKINQTVIIGDGFGTMTTLLLENKLSKQIILVNLRKTLLVDLLYINKIIGEKRFDEEVILVEDIKNLSKIEDNHKIIALEAENYNILSFLEKDLVLNIASFQEMDLAVIINYFKYLYKQKSKSFYFYLCNREEKFLPDGSLIRFKDYPFNPNDIIITDELCPWHQDFYSFKPPFIRLYDGPTRHQLRKVNNNM